MDITGNNYEKIDIEDGVVFDGKGYTITYKGTNAWNGLFKPVNDAKFTIKNVNFVLDGDSAKINTGGGVLFATSWSSSGNHVKNYNITIKDCHLSSTDNSISRIGEYAGGLCGSYFGNESQCLIEGCSNSW